MRWSGFRRSDNVEDYRDPDKPVNSAFDRVFETINEVLRLTTSKLAKDLGQPRRNDADRA